MSILPFIHNSSAFHMKKALSYEDIHRKGLSIGRDSATSVVPPEVPVTSPVRVVASRKLAPDSLSVASNPYWGAIPVFLRPIAELNQPLLMRWHQNDSASHHNRRPHLFLDMRTAGCYDEASSEHGPQKAHTEDFEKSFHLDSLPLSRGS